jgi:hypothetical protein
MSKPWDKLRKALLKPPIAMGRFTCTDGSIVQWNPRFNEDDEASAEVWVNDVGLQKDNECLGSTDLREIGEFFIELADQLDSQ